MNIKTHIILLLMGFCLVGLPPVAYGQSVQVKLDKQVLEPGDIVQAKVIIENPHAGSTLKVYEIDPKGGIAFQDTSLVIEAEWIRSEEPLEITFSVFVPGPYRVIWQKDFALVGEMKWEE